MKKVLIIDDDALVRMFLKQIISWEKEGYQIVGDARDGEEGLMMFHQFHPDLVIVDVSMPVMNGIDFLKALKEQEYHGGIIILSCHDDFEYVKAAMALGADEYLLKNHLNEKGLLEVLHAVDEQVKKRYQEQNQQEELVAFAQKGMVELRKEALLKLLSSKDKTDTLQQELFDAAHIRGSYRQCGVVLAHLPLAEKEKKEAFLELCQQIAVSNQVEMIPLRKRVCAFLVDLSDYTSGHQQHERLHVLPKVIHNYGETYLGVHLSIGSSTVCCDEDSVVRAISQGEKALLLSFYQPGTWTYTDSERLSGACPPEAEELVTGLSYLIQLGDEEKLIEGCSKALDAVVKHWVMPDVVIDWIRRCDMTANVRQDPLVYKEIESFQQLDHTDIYLRYLRKLKSVHIPDHLSPAVKQAADYVKTHFYESCTLSDAANDVGLTPTYLSARFKQEMGIGFVDYLTDVRINHVKWLMKREKHDTMKNISERAGFTDYQHFCKVFKRRVGLSPAAFRKN